MIYCSTCESNIKCTSCLSPYYLKSDFTSCISNCANEIGFFIKYD